MRLFPFVVALALGVAAAPAFAQAPAQGAPLPLRVGGAIRAPQKIKNVPPVYPAAAMRDRVEGVVILELTVAPSGQVSYARILKSVPALDQAAIDAVFQWEYTPTLLNGVPVSVLYNVTVAFSLKNSDATGQPIANATAPSTVAADAAPAGGAVPVQPFPTVRVGGAVRAPTKLVDVPPQYPEAFQGYSGVVILELVVTPEGNVQDVTVLRSVPELDQFAIDAVRQWVYTPTILDGAPVGVIYNVTVAFSARR